MRDLINKVAPTLYLYSDREDRDDIMRDGIAADAVVITTKLMHDNRDVWEIDLDHDFTLDHIPADCLNLLSERIMEAPIADISHLGDWEKSSSYRDPRDRKLLTSVKALNKIKTMWKYPTEVDFNIILINNAEANRQTELGMIDRKTIPDLFPVSADSIEALLRDDQVNIIFTNNKGAERVPMTGWIMAHRFGHALYAGRGRSFYMKEALATFNRYLGDILNEYGIGRYKPMENNGPVTRFLEHLCIFRSAREKNLRSSFEAFYELFAQYIIRGAITFNPLPKSFKFGPSYYTYARPEDDYEYDNRAMEEMGDEMRQYFETAVHYAVGKVLVM